MSTKSVQKEKAAEHRHENPVKIGRKERLTSVKIIVFRRRSRRRRAKPSERTRRQTGHPITTRGPNERTNHDHEAISAENNRQKYNDG